MFHSEDPTCGKAQVEKSVVLTENQASSSRSTGKIADKEAKGWLSYAKVSCVPGGSVVKNLPANARATGDMGSSLGWEDPLKEEMSTQSNIPAGTIPRTEEPSGLQFIGSQRVGHD